MRKGTPVLVLAALSLSPTVGCQKQPAPPAAPAPIVSGELIGVTLWEKPVQRPGETGSNSGTSVKEGRVDVYDRFIVVTRPDGTRMMSQHGWYTGLTFK